MKKIILTVVIMVLGDPSMAEELLAEKRELIDRVRELTGTTAIELSQRFIDEYSSNVATSIGKRNPNMGPRHHEIMKEEISVLVTEGLKNDKRLDNIAYSIYSKNFKLKELEEIVAFIAPQQVKNLCKPCEPICMKVRTRVWR